MSSEYTLLPRIRRPRICKGENIEIEVYITGYGERIVDNKLHISYSSPKLLKIDNEGKVGIIESCIKTLKTKDIITGVITGDVTFKNKKTGKIEKAFEQVKLDPTGMTITLNEGYFISYRELNELVGKEVDINDKRYVAEVKYDNHPPILISINTDSNAPPGDYIITLSLFYKDKNTVKIDQKHIPVHINTYIEQHQKKIQAIGISIGLAAFITGLIETYYTILQYLHTIKI